jgi:hypothetical protein
MIKLKEILQGKKLLNEATYVAGKLQTLFAWSKKYLFDEGSIGKQTFWNRWTREGFIENVTESFSVKEGLEEGRYKKGDITKFKRSIDKAYADARSDMNKLHDKFEKNIRKATKPFDKEYTGV